MNTMLARVLLRAVAVTIAIAAVIDPVFTNTEIPAAPVVIVHLTSTSPDDVDRALRSHMTGRELDVRAPAGSRLPCARDERCVVIADGSIDADVDTDLPISLITMPPGGQPNVAIRSALVSGGHRAAAGTARVALSGEGVAGKRTEVRILDAGAVIGSAIHEWSSLSSATVDVSWWPLDLGARALHIEAVPIAGETTLIDNALDAGVNISGVRSPVLVFDARPSWNSTFVRRALEDDARFTVGYRARVAPALTAGTVNGRLDAATLDKVSLVIIGGPDALAADDVALLDRYVRVRGGTVVMLPEQRVSGASSSMFPGTWTEHLTANAESIGPLHATEILRVNNVAATSTVIARSGSASAIVSTPTGNGRIIVSGAMDAWRYRQLDAGAFDRFWQSLAAEGAAAGDGLRVTFDRAIAASGSRAGFTLRDRRLDPRSTIEASAVVRCGDGAARTIRLWPGGALGEFVGEIPAAVPGQCTIEATVDDRQIIASIAIVDRPARGTSETLAKLERQTRESGGVVARAGEEERVAGEISAKTDTLSRVVSTHPMRAPWWILPFAGCLSVEWWLRRRNGLR